MRYPCRIRQMAYRNSVKMQIPLKLQHIDFIVAWEKWRAYRGSIGKLTPFTEELQMRACNDMGPERAIAAIEHSIANDKHGLFEPGDAQPANEPQKFVPMKPRRNEEALRSIDLPEGEREKILAKLKGLKLTIENLSE